MLHVMVWQWKKTSSLLKPKIEVQSSCLRLVHLIYRSHVIEMNGGGTTLLLRQQGTAGQIHTLYTHKQIKQL